MAWLLLLQNAPDEAESNLVGLVLLVVLAVLLTVLTTGGVVIDRRKQARWAERLRAEQEDRLTRLRETLHGRHN